MAQNLQLKEEEKHEEGQPQMSNNAKSWLLSLAPSHQAAGGSLPYHGRP